MAFRIYTLNNSQRYSMVCMASRELQPHHWKFVPPFPLRPLPPRPAPHLVSRQPVLSICEFGVLVLVLDST